MRLITANIDIDELIKNQDTVDWEDILNNDFNQEEINKLCANVKNEDFWKIIAKNQKHVNKVDVKYLLQQLSNKVFCNRFLRNHTFTKAEIIYFFNYVNNNNFATLHLFAIVISTDYLDEDENLFCMVVNNVNSDMGLRFLFEETEIGTTLDVKYLTQYESKIKWETYLDNREFTEAEIQYLCGHIQDKDFWWKISTSDLIKLIDVKTLIQHQDNINWKCIYKIVHNHMTVQDINYLCKNFQCNDDYSTYAFWSCILNSQYINNIDVICLAKYQHRIKWDKLFDSRKFTELELQYLCNHIDNESFWDNYWRKYIGDDYFLHMNVKWLVEHQDKLIWSVVHSERIFTEQEIKYCCEHITTNSFWWSISIDKYVQYLDVKYFVKYQDIIAWEDVLFNVFYKFDEQEVKYLCDNVKNEDFWDILISTDYIDNVDVKYFAQKQDIVVWKDIFNNREFTEEEKEYLYRSVKNDECLKILNTKEKVSKMSYQEIINNRNAINWKNIDLEDLNINENEKKLLLTRIPYLGVKHAENIEDDFSQIKNKPIKRFYTIGDRNMHGNRTGAFVIVKDGNNPVDIMFEPGGQHDGMLEEMAEKYDYNQDILMKLMNVEAGMEEISGKMDLDTEAEKEMEYAKEHLHCCCGYVHVDSNNENPIAIMDATRVYNFSPQQVAKILKDKKYEGQEIIAFGINDAGASSIAFMKVAKIIKKRLISHNYRILYWYNNGC